MPLTDVSPAANETPLCDRPRLAWRLRGDSAPWVGNRSGWTSLSSTGRYWRTNKSKHGPTRLGFTLLLKCYMRHDRFPRGRAEFADEFGNHVARQVKVPASELGLYDWERPDDRVSPRPHPRSPGVSGVRGGRRREADAVAGGRGGARRTSPRSGAGGVAAALPPGADRAPTSGRLTRMVRSALHVAEENWFAVIAARLEEPVHGRVLGLVDFSPGRRAGRCTGRGAGVIVLAGRSGHSRHG